MKLNLELKKISDGFWQYCNEILVEETLVVKRLILSFVQELLHKHQTALAEDDYDLKNKFERKISKIP